MLQGKVEKVLDCGKNGKVGKEVYIIVGTFAMTESHNAPPKATLSNGAARPLHPMALTGSSYIKSK